MYYPSSQVLPISTSAIPLHKCYPSAQVLTLSISATPLHKCYPSAHVQPLKVALFARYLCDDKVAANGDFGVLVDLDAVHVLPRHDLPVGAVSYERGTPAGQRGTNLPVMTVRG